MTNLPQNEAPRAYPETSNAVLALLLAIAAWLLGFSLITAIPGWWLAKAELSAIREGRRDPSQQGLAQAAYWLAIANIVLSVIGCCVGIAFFSTIMGALGLAAVGSQPH